MTRPAPPAPVTGYRWVARPTDDVRPLVTKAPGRDWKCSKPSGSHYRHAPCNAVAIAEVRPPDGGPHWLYRCPNHLDGAWIEFGLGWIWALEERVEATKVKIRGLTVESREIEIEREEYDQAKRSGRLDHELDVFLSDMDGETVVIEADGRAISPYRGREVDLLELLVPVLDLLPTWRIEQYVTGRRSEEEE